MNPIVCDKVYFGPAGAFEQKLTVSKLNSSLDPWWCRQTIKI